MTYYIGIDPSLTHTGFIVIDEKDEVIKKLVVSTSSKLQIEERISLIMETVINSSIFPIIMKEDIGGIGIEGLSFGSRGQSMLELSGLHYCLRMRLQEHNIKYTIIAPSSLKKFVTGKGNCKKELMLLKVFQKWGVEFDDDNLADAYGLAQKVKDMHIKEGEDTLTKAWIDEENKRVEEHTDEIHHMII